MNSFLSVPELYVRNRHPWPTSCATVAVEPSPDDAAAAHPAAAGGSKGVAVAGDGDRDVRVEGGSLTRGPGAPSLRRGLRRSLKERN